MQFPETKEIVVAFGFSEALYQAAKKWLAKSEARRLFVVGPKRLFFEKQIRSFPLETPLDVEPMAQKAALEAVLLSFAWIVVEEIPWRVYFQEAFSLFHRGASLSLSDAADFGVRPFANACRNLARPFRWALDLSGAFSGVPAVIVGAGPSLEKSRKALAAWGEGALVFAAGSAGDQIGALAHVRGRVDPGAAQRGKSPSTPLCFSPRVESTHLAEETAPLLLAPDAHFPFLNWIAGVESQRWLGGWTAGNFLTEIAFRWGCNPIVLVGMDGCAAEEKEGLFSTKNREGKEVWTRRDWVESVRWTADFARENPERTWISVDEGGLPLSSLIEERKPSDLAFPRLSGLRLAEAIEALPLRQGEVRLSLWEKALREREKPLQEALLEPLWRLWEPVFARSLASDSHLLSDEEKLKMHKELFEKRVVEEHLRVIS